MSKNDHARLYTHDEYAKLTRDGMYQALLYVSPTLAKGKSRARKEELIELYKDAANTDSIPVVKVSESGPERVEPSDEPPPRVPPEKMVEVNESVDAKKHRYKDGGPDCVDCGAFGPNTEPSEPCPGQVPTIEDNDDLEEGQEASMAWAQEVAHHLPNHIHGPECEHDHTPLPRVAGVEELQRVNPEMPVTEFEDGAVFQIPPDPSTLLFTFKGAPRELTEKEKYLLDSMQKNFETFRTNPANSDAKKATLRDIYALKVSGIIVNEKFSQTIKEGRDYVRDVRRKMKLGVDVGESVREAQQEAKDRESVREAQT